MKRSDEDANFTETMRNAEIENIGNGLLKSAQRLVALIDASRR